MFNLMLLILTLQPQQNTMNFQLFNLFCLAGLILERCTVRPPSTTVVTFVPYNMRSWFPCFKIPPTLICLTSPIGHL